MLNGSDTLWKRTSIATQRTLSACGVASMAPQGAPGFRLLAITGADTAAALKAFIAAWTHTASLRGNTCSLARSRLLSAVCAGGRLSAEACSQVLLEAAKDKSSTALQGAVAALQATPLHLHTVVASQLDAVVAAACGRDLCSAHAAAALLAAVAQTAAGHSTLHSALEILCEKLSGPRTHLPVWQQRVGAANALRCAALAAWLGKAQGQDTSATLHELQDKAVHALLQSADKETHEGSADFQLAVACQIASITCADDVQPAHKAAIEAALKHADKNPVGAFTALSASVGGSVAFCAVACELPHCRPLAQLQGSGLPETWAGLEAAYKACAVPFTPNAAWVELLHASAGEACVKAMWTAVGNFGGKLAPSAALTAPVLAGAAAANTLIAAAVVRPQLWDIIGDCSMASEVTKCAAAARKRGAKDDTKAPSKKMTPAEKAKLKALMTAASKAAVVATHASIDLPALVAAPGSFLTAKAVVEAADALVALDSVLSLSQLAVMVASTSARSEALTVHQSQFAPSPAGAAPLLQSLSCGVPTGATAARRIVGSLREAAAQDAEPAPVVGGDSKKKSAGTKAKAGGSKPKTGKTASSGAGAATVDTPQVDSISTTSDSKPAQVVLSIVQQLLHRHAAVRALRRLLLAEVYTAVPAMVVACTHAFASLVTSTAAAQAKSTASVAAAKSMGAADPAAIADAKLLKKDPVQFFAGSCVPPSTAAAVGQSASTGQLAAAFSERISADDEWSPDAVSRSLSAASRWRDALLAVIPAKLAANAAVDPTVLVPLAFILCHHELVATPVVSVNQKLWRQMHARLSSLLPASTQPHSVSDVITLADVPTARVSAGDVLLSQTSVQSAIGQALVSDDAAAVGSLWSLSPASRAAAARAVQSLAGAVAADAGASGSSAAGLAIVAEWVLPSLWSELHWVWQACAPRGASNTVGAPFLTIDGPAGASTVSRITENAELFALWSGKEAQPCHGIMQQQDALARRIASRSDGKAADESKWFEKLQADMAARAAASDSSAPQWNAHEQWSLRQQSRARRALQAAVTTFGAAADAIAGIADAASGPSCGRLPCLAVATSFVAPLTVLSGVGVLHAHAKGALARIASACLRMQGAQHRSEGLHYVLASALGCIGQSHVAAVEASCQVASDSTAKAASFVESMKISALASGAAAGAEADLQASVAAALAEPAYVLVWNTHGVPSAPAAHGMKHSSVAGPRMSSSLLANSLSSKFGMVPPSAQMTRVARGDLAGGTDFVVYNWACTASGMRQACGALQDIVSAGAVSPALLAMSAPLLGAACCTGHLSAKTSAVESALAVMVASACTTPTQAAGIAALGDEQVRLATVVDTCFDLQSPFLWDMAAAAASRVTRSAPVGTYPQELQLTPAYQAAALSLLDAALLRTTSGELLAGLVCAAGSISPEARAAIDSLHSACSTLALGCAVDFDTLQQALVAGMGETEGLMELPAGARMQAYLPEECETQGCIVSLAPVSSIVGRLGAMNSSTEARRTALVLMGTALTNFASQIQGGAVDATDASVAACVQMAAKGLWVAVQMPEDGPASEDEQEEQDAAAALQPTQLAREVWSWAAGELQMQPPADYVQSLLPLLHEGDDIVRGAVAKSIAASMQVYPSTAAEAVSALQALFEKQSETLVALQDNAWCARAGVMATLQASAGVWTPAGVTHTLPTAQLSAVVDFIVVHGLSDCDTRESELALAAGQDLVKCAALGGKQAEAITELLNTHVSSLGGSAAGAAAGEARAPVAPKEDLFAAMGGKGGVRRMAAAPKAGPSAAELAMHDAKRRGCVVMLGSAAAHLPEQDRRIDAALDTLVATLSVPSESVQRAVSSCLPPLMKKRKVPAGGNVAGSKAAAVVASLLHTMVQGESYGDRRGAAFGLAGCVKGLGLGALKSLGIVAKLEVAAESKAEQEREGAMLAFECLSQAMGVLFEPYVIRLLPHLLRCFGDKADAVREAAGDAARIIMGKLTGHGVKMLLPSLLEGCSDVNWRSKAASITLLGSMAFCAPRQLAAALPTIVPRVIEAFQDAHPKVQGAADGALADVGHVIRNPEIKQQSKAVLAALADPGKHTGAALDSLWNTSWVHTVDPPSLALLVPILRRGLTDRTPGAKLKAATIVGKLTSLVSDVAHITPYLPALLAPLKRCCVDSMPDVRSTAAVAVASLVTGAGEVTVAQAYQQGRAAEIQSRKKSLSDAEAMQAAMEEEDDALPGVVGWAYRSLSEGLSTVERAGGAQALAEYMVAAGPTRLVEVLQGRIMPLSSPPAGSTNSVANKEGCLWTLAFLPSAMISQANDGGAFAPLIPLTLPLVIAGLADDISSVRDVALKAGTVMVTQHAKSYAGELLPPLRSAQFAENWRIRENSVRLLGELLVQIATGRSLTQRGTDEYGSSAGGGNANGEIGDDAGAAAGAVDTKAARKAKAKAAREARAAKRAAEEAAAAAAAEEAGEEQEDDDDLAEEDELDEYSTALVKAMGLDMRNEVTADIYCVLSGDSSSQVRQTALQVFKAFVPHAPRVVKQVLPALMSRLIGMLAADSAEHRSVAGRALGDVVKRLGDTVLPRVVPLLQQGLSADNPGVRQGVCLGLGEVISASYRSDLQEYMSTLLPAVQQALCDESVDVQVAAAQAFNTLQRVAGDEVLNAIVPALLKQLDSQQGTEGATRAMSGLRQVLSVRGDDVLPFLIPKLVSPQPLSNFQMRALAAVAEVTGDKIYAHFNTVLPPILSVLSGEHSKGDRSDAAVQARLDGEAGTAAKTLVLSVHGQGVQWLVVELCNAIGGSSIPKRWVAAWLLEAFVTSSGADYVQQAPIMIKELVYKLVLADHKPTLLAIVAALRGLVGTLGAVPMQEHLGFLRDCLRSSASEAKWASKSSAAQGAAAAAAAAAGEELVHTKRDGSDYVVPGLGVPKGLDAFYPVYQEGLLHGGSSQRQLAATAVGELVELTDPKALRPYLVKLTGPLIRVVGDKHSAEVKAAILGSLNKILTKGGDMLRPFLPQLSTSMVRCLQDPAASVRRVAGDGLGKVMALSKRVDPIVNEVLNNIGTTMGGIKESMTAALKEVLQHAGAKLTPTMRSKAVEALLPLLVDVDDVVRAVAAAAAGAFLPHLEQEEAQPLLDFVNNTGGVADELAASTASAGSSVPALGLGLGGVDLSSMAGGSEWITAQSRLVTLRAIMKYASGTAPAACAAVASSSVASLLENSTGASAKQQVREACSQAASWIIQASEADDSGAMDVLLTPAVEALVALCDDASKDVRACAFASLKLCFKRHPGCLRGSASADIVRVLASGVKATSAAVKLSAERAAVYYLDVRHKGPTEVLEGMADLPEDPATVLKLYAGRVLVKQTAESDDEDEDADYTAV